MTTQVKGTKPVAVKISADKFAADLGLEAVWAPDADI